MAKKRFKNTKFGKFLYKAAPGIIEVVGDVFPPAKVLTRFIKIPPSPTKEE